MPLTRGQDDGHQLAVTFGTDMDLVLKPPWLRSTLRSQGPLCTGGVLVRTHNGAIDIVDFPVQFTGGIGRLLNCRKEVVPGAPLCASVESGYRQSATAHSARANPAKVLRSE